MNDLMPFDYSGRQVRTILRDGEAWFVIADVCTVLELRNPSMAAARVDTDDLSIAEVIDSMGRTQVARIANESGLYDLIFLSRKPEAKAFKRWVTHTVLPEIRRTGQFGSQVPTSLAEALEFAAARQRAIEAAEAKIAADAPKVEAYDALMDADGYYTMMTAAKVLGIGRTTLFRRLRDLGILQRGSNLPYERYAHHFAVTASSWTDPQDNVHTSYTTRVRPSGLDYLRKRLVSAQPVGEERR